jgi:hypothetical protein
MELTAIQRKAVFALIVVLLAGLGSYLFATEGSGSAPPAASPPRPHASAAPAVSSPAPATPAPATPAPAAAGSSSGSNIYQWLPFTQSGLNSAASVISQFANAYGTWSYSQNANAYVATMSRLITPDLSQVLAQDYSVPGVASQRTSKKQVSTGTSVINSLRSFGPSSITFVVTITQEITATNGRDQVSAQYAVTATGAGSGWQVSDIEQASAGNQ